MVALPEFSSPVADAIYAAYVKRNAGEPRRGHLGASSIGRSCRRDIWYSFRWAADPVFGGRMLRLFESGKLEEARVFNNLRAIGCEAYSEDPSSGRQFWFGEFGDHFSGSLDGAILGVPDAPKTWHVLEIKTHNVKSFQKLKANGVQVAKPEHLAQIQAYLGWSGMERALYFAVCKDSDEIYTERVAFDPVLFEQLRVKALMIIEAAAPPDRHESPLCTWCAAQELCHGAALPLYHCRTCLYAAPVTHGTGAHWTCTRDHHDIPFLLQARGCEHHLFIPELLPGVVVERGDGFVVYQRGEQYFVNSSPAAFPACSAPHYRSSSLAKMPIGEVGR